MNENKMVEECLTELFRCYLEDGGGGIYSLAEIIKKHGYTPEQGGNILVDNGWVKDQQFYITDFGAAISIQGINKINPHWMNDKVHKVMSTLYFTGGEWQGILAILEMPRKDYAIAFDISKILELMNLTELQRHPDDIRVSLTQAGRDFCEANKPRWQK